MIGCVITRRVSEFAQPRANLLYAASLPDHNNLQDDAPCGRQIVVGTPLGGDIGDDVVDAAAVAVAVGAIAAVGVARRSRSPRSLPPAESGTRQGAAVRGPRWHNVKHFVKYRNAGKYVD